MEELAAEVAEISQNQTESRDPEVNDFYHKSTINLLARGVLERYEPGLTKTKLALEELTTKQFLLIEQIHNENLKLTWSPTLDELNSLFTLIKEHHQKLINIKKNMKVLHERSTKLKKRAIRLQQIKDKEESLKIQQLQHEQSLIGKPAPK